MMSFLLFLWQRLGQFVSFLPVLQQFLVVLFLLYNHSLYIQLHGLRFLQNQLPIQVFLRIFFILRSEICLFCMTFLKFSMSVIIISFSLKFLKYGIICAFIKTLYALTVLILIFLFLQFSKNILQAATTVISKFLHGIFLSTILNLSCCSRHIGSCKNHNNSKICSPSTSTKT